MSRLIVLLRGINVGGRNRLRMAELVEILEGLGLEDVRTYIQSGNVVARSSEPPSSTLAAAIGGTIERSHGFRPRVLVLAADELEAAIASNPFPEGESRPKELHFFFLTSSPTEPHLDSLDEVKADTERFHLADRVLYLHAPEGIGRSKLAANVERILGVAATARNWRTVQKLREMAGMP